MPRKVTQNKFGGESNSPYLYKKLQVMFHQFVLDYLEFILAIIIGLQGIILFRSNHSTNWIISHLNNVYVILKAQASLTLDHEDKLKGFPNKKEGGL